MEASRIASIGIYVRESRDDYGEKIETIENQRDMLVAYAKNFVRGNIYEIYTDNNVSGSSFDRSGLKKLKKDVLDNRITILLLKDLSRLGRNNAKTLQFLDFLEEHGIRIVCSDGRYDSMRDNDTVGLETWVNERYVRDLSRKIRSCLHFKIQRGEYIGNAPFGYFKAGDEKNKLTVDGAEAEIVRLIFRLYKSGLGYTAIAAYLNERGCLSPTGGGWNRMSVRRILCSRVYIGDTVQGVSEKISFKSKKTRRLPQDEWVITEGTHEPIISKEEFYEVNSIRKSKGGGRGPNKGKLHIFRGLVWCGGCGSVMYARKRDSGIKYICGNYFRNGLKACSSHLISEEVILKPVCEELKRAFEGKDYYDEVAQSVWDNIIAPEDVESRREDIIKQRTVRRRQQEILYTDRLTGKISEQLFLRMNSRIEGELKNFAMQLDRSCKRQTDFNMITELIEEVVKRAERGDITNELVRLLVKKVTVYSKGDTLYEKDSSSVVIDFLAESGV